MHEEHYVLVNLRRAEVKIKENCCHMGRATSAGQGLNELNMFNKRILEME